MKSRVVSPEELDPQKGLQAEGYVGSGPNPRSRLTEHQLEEIVFKKTDHKEEVRRIFAIMRRRQGPTDAQSVAREALLIGLSALEGALDELENLGKSDDDAERTPDQDSPEV